MVELNHIAIIVSKVENLRFYEKFGFQETKRFVRPQDIVVFMECNGIALEFFIDPNHPERVHDLEAMGLRHVAFTVEHLEDIDVEMESVRTNWFGQRFTFAKDPDGLPIEIVER